MKSHENISNAFFNKMKKQAVFSDIYRFFDFTIAMKADGKEQLDWLRRLYPRFQMEKAKQKVDATYYMMVKTPKGPLVIAEENSHLKVKTLDDVDFVSSYAYLLAYNYIAANLTSHFLLHGAALSWNVERAASPLNQQAAGSTSDGLAIAGSSGSGKTTLMLELLLNNPLAPHNPLPDLSWHFPLVRGIKGEKGFKFLSDDQLAINRTTHKIDPSPRSIGIRESALALFDGRPDLSGEIPPLKRSLRDLLEHLEPQTVIGGERKWFVDIEEISENGLGEPCRLKYLVFLVNSLSESEGEKDNEQRTRLPRQRRRQVELAVDSVNDELLEKLRLFAKTGEIHSRRMRSCYALSFRPEAEAISALEFERLCQSCGVWLLDVRKKNTIKPNFHATPTLQRIPRSIAVFELLKKMRNDFRENPCQTYMELAGALENVECYRLSVGRLDEMARLICGLVIP